MNLIIQPATETDSHPIKKLLDDNDLPTSDLDQSNVHLFIGLIDSKMAGVIGIEKRNNVGLLRSLAVEDSFKGQGVGRELTLKLIDLCTSDNIEKLFLLTMTAKKYFEKFGFVEIDRVEVPDEIKQTREFKDICPASSVVMYKELKS